MRERIAWGIELAFGSPEHFLGRKVRIAEVRSSEDWKS
jgi:hypothetical protein